MKDGISFKEPRAKQIKTKFAPLLQHIPADAIPGIVTRLHMHLPPPSANCMRAIARMLSEAELVFALPPAVSTQFNLRLFGAVGRVVAKEVASEVG